MRDDGALARTMQQAGRFEKLRRFYTGLAVFGLNTLIVLVVLNILAWIGVRAYSRYVFARTPLGKYNQDKLLRAYPGWDWEDLQVLLCCSLPYEYEPYTGHRNLPETRKYLTVDERGFRHVANQGPWPPSNEYVNVFFFGGSTSFGSGVPDEDTVASHLQAELNQRLGTDAVRVYNFGRVHYISLQERILLENLLLEGHVPDFAVFLDGLNDFHRNDGTPALTEEIRELLHSQEVARSRERLELVLTPFRRMPILTLARQLRDSASAPSLTERLTPEQIAAEYDPVEKLEGAAERYVRNQALIRAVAAPYGIQTLFVIQPIPTYKYDISYHVFSEGDLGYFHEANFAGFGYRILEGRRSALERQEDFLWLADMQEDVRENLYCDSIHYTSAFAKTISSAIADRLVPGIENAVRARASRAAVAIP